MRCATSVNGDSLAWPGLARTGRPFREFADVLKAPVDPGGLRIWRVDAPCPVSRGRHADAGQAGCHMRKRGVVSERDTFERLLASLHKAALDPDLWPTTSALIDEAVAAQGNALLIAEGIRRDAPMLFAAGYYRGERRPDLERDYLGNYHPWDERVVGLRRLPDSKLVHITELYSEQQLKTSRSYNEFSGRSSGQNSLNVRMDGPDGSNITWAILDPVKGRDWQSAQIQMIERLLPHIRQFVRVRQALANAKALGVSLTRLLDNMRLGVVHLDRRGRIIEANDRARGILERRDGLFDRGGFLHARVPADDTTLQQLLARALPTLGSEVTGGSMRVRRLVDWLPLALHVDPVSSAELDFGGWPVFALVLIEEPDSRARISSQLVALRLGLSPAESRVAAALAEGLSVRQIAAVTGRKEGSVRWQVSRIYQKLGISRQVDLVRLVLSVTELPGPWGLQAPRD